MSLFAHQLQVNGHIGPIDMQLGSGQWLLLAGGNGAGKTLLCHAFAGWVPQITPVAYDGQLQFQQRDLLSDSPLNHQQQLLQATPHWSGCAFTVADEIAFGLANLNLSEAEIDRRLAEVLTLCNCHPLAQRHPAELSGGEAQRVALACALAMQPTLLVLDQAFSRLTPAAHWQLLQRLKQYSQAHGMTVILAEMALQPSLALVDKVLLLQPKQAAQFDSPTALLPTLLQQLLCSDAWQALGNALQNGQRYHWLPLDDQQLLRWLEEHPNADY